MLLWYNTYSVRVAQVWYVRDAVVPIQGVTPSGQPYEDLFCKDSGQMGVALLGDSAGAHFHIPEKFLMAPTLTKVCCMEGHVSQCLSTGW